MKELHDRNEIRVVLAARTPKALTTGLLGWWASPIDPIGLGGAALFVLVIAVAAGVFAAQPAMRSDPMVALRDE